MNDGGPYSSTYDAENRISAYSSAAYTYDGDGKRVKKSTGTLYWTGTGSDALLETDLAGTATAEYIFFGRKRIARVDLPAATVHYYFSDHLGSHSVVTSANGTTIEQEADYYPFGGERVVTAGPNKYKFTGKERDAESGLDYFGARYYASAAARWLSPDWAAKATAVPYADFGNPQSLNLYGYVGNNPLAHADSDGHCCAPYELANYIDSKINAGVGYAQNKAVNSGSPALAATTTFVVGSTGAVGQGFTNMLRTGESVGSLPSGASGTQILNAVAEEGGRIGGTILAVVAVAGPKAPASAESGAQVAGEIGRNRVTMDNGSQVDLAGKPHAGVDTPHIKDPIFNTNPATGQVFQNKFGPVRPATVGDVNAAAKTAGGTPPVGMPPPLPVPKKSKD
ncbi:MAG: polymorphic toxin type 24 domain-containing protein [Acidobacteriota bacterium]|nr:polymorphic toxin type 24 domain-containing protein [Acidobacteriota bacterium]